MNGDGASGPAGEEPPDDPRIRTLDEATVRQIAAGEVVERPASVVKELVENSLDADATRVTVAVERGGVDGIRVRDDGVGMTEEEVRLAVEEHTTSKITGIADLDSGVGTLGFRGEALHTIGAVSRLTLRSKPRGVPDAGTELRVEGGEVESVAAAGCPEGTAVEVGDLFFNTPARRKFLKTEATEFDHVNTVVTQYALANPDVAVTLEHDGREVFATEGRGSLESTVLSVYGREVAEAMVEVEHEPDAGPLDAVRGLVSHPETNRSSRDHLSTFVNGRYVTASPLREGALSAYGDQLAPDRYPFAVLFVDLPGDAVDVNVHPRKMEVRFDDEAGVREAVEAAVREALLSTGLLRSSAARGRSAPAETTPAPESPDATAHGGDTGTTDGDTESTGDGTERRDAAPTDGVEPSPTGPESGESAGRAASGTEATSGAMQSADEATGPETESAPRGPDDQEDPAEPGPDSDGAGRADRPGGGRPTVGSASAGSSRRGESRTDEGRQSSLGDGDAAESAVADAEPRPESFVGPTTQRTLDDEAAALEPEFDRLPPMRVLGQAFDTYLVCETPEGLVLVDQHAADERVTYERIREEVAGKTPTQALAEPVTLELTAREAALFEEYREALAQVGFHAGRTGERTVEVRTVPAVFEAALDPSLLRDALTAFVSDGEDDGGRATVDAVADDLLADLACYPSLTGNTSLTEGSVVDLLGALDGCENPYACPHGRPVLIEFDRGEIDDRFERDYPGRAGRREE